MTTTGPSTIRILVGDDHTLFRAVDGTVQRDPQFEVVADAGDAARRNAARRNCSLT